MVFFNDEKKTSSEKEPLLESVSDDRAFFHILLWMHKAIQNLAVNNCAKEADIIFS